MKKVILLILLFSTNNLIYAHCFLPLDWEDPLCHMNKGVKQIIEKSMGKWSAVYKFDIHGFLTEHESYYKGEKRLKDNISYSTIGDTILSITIKNTLKSIDNIKFTKNFYYNKSNYYYTKFEIYSSKPSESKPLVIGRNFMYEDSLLCSYIRNHDTIKYTYNTIGQIVMREILSPTDIRTTEYKYDQKNRLRDLITVSNRRNPQEESTNEFLGIVTYSEDSGNKYHIRFDNFDKEGNWTKSYFVTKNGQKFRSKRVLIYQ